MLTREDGSKRILAVNENRFNRGTGGTSVDDSDRRRDFAKHKTLTLQPVLQKVGASALPLNDSSSQYRFTLSPLQS
jgi:hypothetical protein